MKMYLILIGCVWGWFGLVEAQNGAEFSKPFRDGLIHSQFIVPPTFLNANKSLPGAPGTDPFGPEVSQPAKRLNAQQILEAAGVTFGEGARAIFNPGTSTLIVVQTPEQMKQVGAYVEALRLPVEKNIRVRIEIFELPSLIALEAVASAANHGIHTPERQALKQMVEQGKARLVTTQTVIARSGNRAKIEKVERVIAFTGFKNGDGKNPDNSNLTKLREIYEEVPFGTVLEVEPILGGDDKTIDLNISLEHHTAPPVSGMKEVQVLDTDKFTSVKVTEFSRKQIFTMVSVLSGNYVLLGNWIPTGTDYEGKELMHLVFVHAVVAPVCDVGEIK